MSVPSRPETVKGILSRLPLLTNGEALVGLAWVVTGAVIAWDGARQLWAGWKALLPYLPFTLPADTAGIILNSLPLIVTLFICMVSSICAVLIGLMWVFGGIADAYRSRKLIGEAADFQYPELVAESLASSAPRHWPLAPRGARIMGFVWPAARFMSPVSYDTCRSTVGTLWKVLLAATAIAIVTYALPLLPGLVKRFLHQNIMLVVPSAVPLYHLLILVAAVDVAAALSLLPLRARTFGRNSRSLIVGGQGDPHLLFALIEEGARLLTPKDRGTRPAVRLVSTVSKQLRGTLVESAATQVRFLGRPAGYVCVPLAMFMLIAGFNRLVHFIRPVAQMSYADFLQRHVMDYALAVAFAFGMIIAGLHFAQLAGKIFSIRRFQSSLLFCEVTQADATAQKQPPPKDDRGAPEEPAWKLCAGVDDQFAAWARQPSGSIRFRMRAYWAEAISEAAGEAAARHITSISSSRRLDEAMARILDLPFRVSFRIEAIEPQSQEGGREEAKNRSSDE